jgi:guanylate kinase
VISTPPLFVISGPSGAGKGTALDWFTRSGLVRRIPTYTTRLPRSTERDGIDYNFVTEEHFIKLRDQGYFVEHTRTYSDSYYGSPHDLLEANDPMPLVVELEPTGFAKIRIMSSRRVVGIFVTTRTESELRSRITQRGQASDAENRLRIRNFQQTWAWIYDYVLINDTREDFLEDLSTVVRSELLRSRGLEYVVTKQQDAALNVPRNEASDLQGQ